MSHAFSRTALMCGITWSEGIPLYSSKMARAAGDIDSSEDVYHGSTFARLPRGFGAGAGLLIVLAFNVYYEMRCG